MQKRMFWVIWMVLDLIAGVVLPFWWALVASIPTGILAWWVAYKSDWFV